MKERRKDSRGCAAIGFDFKPPSKMISEKHSIGFMHNGRNVFDDPAATVRNYTNEDRKIGIQRSETEATNFVILGVQISFERFFGGPSFVNPSKLICTPTAYSYWTFIILLAARISML